MNIIQKAAIGSLAAVTLLATAPVFALSNTAGVDASANATVGSTDVSASADARLQVRITNAKSHADQEVDRRITALNDLNTRVQAMVRVSSAYKTTVASNIAGQVSALAALKAKIDADSDIATLKMDIASITASYRIFMLIIPQGRIEVAADKIATVAESLTTLSGKLQAYISGAGASGKDVTAMTAIMTDMNAKIADSKVQAAAAVALIASLTPDNGDKTKQQANQQALKNARTDIKAALADIDAARKDAHGVVKALHQLGIVPSASASSTATGQTQ